MQEAKFFIVANKLVNCIHWMYWYTVLSIAFRSKRVMLPISNYFQDAIVNNMRRSFNSCLEWLKSGFPWTIE